MSTLLPLNCQVHGRAYDAKTGEAMVGATIIAGNEAAITDENGGYALAVRGASTVDIYYADAHATKSLGPEACSNRIDLRFRFGDVYLRYGACEPCRI